MYLWIVFGAVIIGFIVSLIISIYNYFHYDEGIFSCMIAVILGGIILIMGIVVPSEINDNKMHTSLFKQQSAYIEKYVPKNDIENAALTSKKIELNEWLFNAQYSVKHFKNWTLVPEEVLDLKPIE